MKEFLGTFLNVVLGTISFLLILAVPLAIIYFISWLDTKTNFDKFNWLLFILAAFLYFFMVTGWIYLIRLLSIFKNI